MQNFIKNQIIAEVMAPVAAASNTDSNSDIIDTANCDGVVFIVPITDSVATGVATLKVEQNTANSDSGMAAISGALVTGTCTTSDDLNNQLLVVEVHKPRERYVQGVVTSATANIAFGNMIAVKYGERKMPITEDSTVIDSALAASAPESA